MQSRRIDPPARSIPRLAKLAFHLSTERRCAAVAVVGVVEAEKIEAIVGEPAAAVPEISASSSRSSRNQKAR